MLGRQTLIFRVDQGSRQKKSIYIYLSEKERI